jgi:hypothetical protein
MKMTTSNGETMHEHITSQDIATQEYLLILF